MYERRYAAGGPAGQGREERVLVICSFSSEEFSYRFPRSYRDVKGKLLLDNYISEEEMKAAKGTGQAGAAGGEGPLRAPAGGKGPRGAGVPGRLLPYEAQVWRFMS